MTRALVVSPHPDDAELGAAALLRPGSTILCLTCTAPRDREARSAAAHLRVDLLTLDLPDGYLTVSPDLVDAIRDLLEPGHYDVVACPPSVDEHQDHRAAAAATRSATRRLPLTVIEYETPSTPPEWAPDTLLPLTVEQHRTRSRALAEHTTQAGLPYLDPDWLWARATTRGARAGLPAAEAYRTLRRTTL